MQTDFEAHCPDIECDGCASAIKRSLGKLPGVTAVDVEVEAKQVRVKYDNSQLDAAALSDRLSQAGFPAE